MLLSRPFHMKRPNRSTGTSSNHPTNEWSNEFTAFTAKLFSLTAVGKNTADHNSTHTRDSHLALSFSVADESLRTAGGPLVLRQVDGQPPPPPP